GARPAERGFDRARDSRRVVDTERIDLCPGRPPGTNQKPALPPWAKAIPQHLQESLRLAKDALKLMQSLLRMLCQLAAGALAHQFGDHQHQLDRILRRNTGANRLCIDAV